MKEATGSVAFRAVIYVVLVAGHGWAQPERVEGMVKKAWKVPIVAKQPNENKPTQVLGNYPELTPDTLARPLKKNQRQRLPFGQFLSSEPAEAKFPNPSSSSAIPNHILQWLSQRQQNTRMTSPEPPSSEAKKMDPQEGSSSPLELRDHLTTKQSLGARLSEETTVKPKLIQRPSYNPQLAEAATTSTTNDDEKITLNPRVAAIIMDDFMERKKDKLSVAGLVIGLTFVAAFIAIAIGLVGHGLVKRCRNGHPSSSGESGFSGRSSRNSWMRSPGDEDQTPPELRSGSQSGHPGYSNNRRRSSGRTRHIPGTLPGHGGTPFFNGKLILHDPPGLTMGNGARGSSRPFNTGNILAPNGGSNTNGYPVMGGGGFTLTSPPSKLGAIPKKMPSQAAQVTDILVSPKYEDGDTTEEEDSDDTVYECPGLAKGAGLEVRNPFFLDGDLQPSTGRLANKKPISQYTDLFHHQEIASLN